MATCDELRAELATLEARYYTLLSGGAIESVSYNGKEVRYSKADLPSMGRRIDGLKAQIAATCGGTFRPRRAIPLIPGG